MPFYFSPPDTPRRQGAALYASPLTDMKVRDRDAFGSGHFGASRDGGKRRHQGIDLIVQPGEPVFSPASGIYLRPARPYAKDKRYSGMVIQADDGAEVKMFYLAPLDELDRGVRLRAGLTLIGHAQDISARYPDRGRGPMTPHIHLQIRRQGRFMDPLSLIDQPASTTPA
ncbi:MAG: peptidoglycan DD-metalloendopeptidase family protein [Rhodospirillales bacterium]